MARFCTLVTAPNFPAIKKATADWFRRPIDLVYDDEKKRWRVKARDGSLGKVNEWYVVKQGTRYHLEILDPFVPPIIHL